MQTGRLGQGFLGHAPLQPDLAHPLAERRCDGHLPALLGAFRRHNRSWRPVDVDTLTARLAP